MKAAGPVLDPAVVVLVDVEALAEPLLQAASRIPRQPRNETIPAALNFPERGMDVREPDRADFVRSMGETYDRGL